MKTKRALGLVAASVLFLACSTAFSPRQAEAKTGLMKTYEYTGNVFMEADGDFVGSSVTGFFTLNCKAAGGTGDCANLSIENDQSIITDISFSAGPVTFEGKGHLGIFNLATDANASIIGWEITFLDFSTERSITTRSGLQFPANDNGIEVPFSGVTRLDPGDWTMSLDPGGRESRSQACQSLIVGTYLLTIEDSAGEFASRAIATFHDDGSLEVVDSAQSAGLLGSGFSEQLGQYSCKSHTSAAAITVNFGFPDNEGVERSDWAVFITPEETIEGQITLNFFTPIDTCNPFDAEATCSLTDQIVFTFTSVRVPSEVD